MFSQNGQAQATQIGHMLKVSHHGVALAAKSDVPTIFFFYIITLPDAVIYKFISHTNADKIL